MASIKDKFSNWQIPFLSAMHVYFDLGTSQTRIALENKGIVLKEPTYLGLNSKIKEYIFFGTEAKTILGKTPDFIKIIRPIVNGILSDFDAEVALSKKFIEKSIYPYFPRHMILKPTMRALTTIPTIATEIEQKAVQEALIKSGNHAVNLIEKPIATAAGCGFDIFSHHPRFIIDMGAGLIELSIISGGGIVSQKTIKNAGEHMNKLISNYTYLKHGVILGEKGCEDLKIELLNFINEEKVTTVRGKSLETGLPKSVKIKTSDIKEALLSSFNHIIDNARELIELSPPEVADEIFKHGITLTGAMAGIKGIDQFIATELKIDTYIAEHFEDATIHGLMALDKRPDDLYRLFGYR
jgi:rod shape-determining protein MreB